MSDQNKQLNTIDSAYLYKKTEKLVSALYLLSSFISDKEPVKWQLREVGLKLLSEVVSVNQTDSQQKLGLGYSQSLAFVSLILSFLEVSYLSGIISQMNYNILKFEFEGLIKSFASDEEGRVKGAILSEEFFDLPLLSKGQAVMSNRITQPSGRVSVKSSQEKSNRQDSIIALLKKGNELGIKDFVSSIKDCSEKTIQRELVSLASKGLIKKQGEKRWSRYMLK